MPGVSPNFQLDINFRHGFLLPKPLIFGPLKPQACFEGHSSLPDVCSLDRGPGMVPWPTVVHQIVGLFISFFVEFTYCFLCLMRCYWINKILKFVTYWCPLWFVWLRQWCCKLWLLKHVFVYISQLFFWKLSYQYLFKLHILEMS